MLRREVARLSTPWDERPDSSFGFLHLRHPYGDRISEYELHRRLDIFTNILRPKPLSWCTFLCVFLTITSGVAIVVGLMYSVKHHRHTVGLPLIGYGFPVGLLCIFYAMRDHGTFDRELRRQNKEFKGGEHGLKWVYIEGSPDGEPRRMELIIYDNGVRVPDNFVHPASDSAPLLPPL